MSERVSAGRVLQQFLYLGCLSFGGPVAHIGYFRHYFVLQQRVITEQRFADMLALSQFLPGPASSQLGVAIGYQLAGWRGGLAAFVGFTLPSLIILMLLGSSWQWWSDSSLVLALKWLAMVVVADALWSMAQQFCQSTQARKIAAAVALAVLLWPSGQWWLMMLVVMWAIWHGRQPGVLDTSVSAALSNSHASGLSPLKSWSSTVLLGLFLLLLLWSWWSHADIYQQLIGLFYRTGATVFGGGHVVLPLLQPELVDVGLLSPLQFGAGYGAAQALPGPLFSVAYFFALGTGVGQVVALLCLLAIFLPGFLLLFALLQHWNWLQQQPILLFALKSLNAAVVGLLAATWLSVLLPSAISGFLSALLAVAGLLWLRRSRRPHNILVLLLIAVFFHSI